MASENLLLPSDTIFEILTRIKSLKALDTCKTVCKEWDGIIKESSFMPNYCMRTNNVSGYFIQGIKRNEFLSQFVSIDQAKGAWSWSNNTRIDKLSHDTQILASCDQGIICCVKQDFEGSLKKPRYYASKPATKQWQKLPNPKLRFETRAVAIMAMDSNDDYLRYKIVRLSYRHNLQYLLGSSAYMVEVFDSKLWSWSQKDDLILPYDEFIISEISGPAVNIDSSLYWLTNRNNVLVFHSYSNSFDKIPLPEPEQVEMTDVRYKLLEYQGKLGCTTVTHKDDIELWVMDNQNLWVKKMAFNLVKETGVQFQSLHDFFNGKIVFMHRGSEVVFHKLEDHSYGIVKLDKIDYVRNVFPLRSDLEPVNLKPKVEEGVQKSSKKLRKMKGRSRSKLWQVGADGFWAVAKYILRPFAFVVGWF